MRSLIDLESDLTDEAILLEVRLMDIYENLQWVRDAIAFQHRHLGLPNSGIENDQ